MAKKATKKTIGATKPARKPAAPVPHPKTKPAAKTAKTPSRETAKPKAPPVKAPAETKARKSTLPAKERELFKGILLRLRDQVTGHISFLADDSLNRVDDTPTEDRTDDFDREFALNLVSSEHDALFEIDEALRRLSEGTYGVCEMCSATIEKPRLQALPFAKLCVRCQSETERGRTKFRPFGSTISQVAERPTESTGPAVEEEETE